MQYQVGASLEHEFFWAQLLVVGIASSEADKLAMKSWASFVVQVAAAGVALCIQSMQTKHSTT